MKVVITSTDKDIESQVDPRFGRARYLLVVDSETMEFESHDNELNMTAAQGAGIQTGQNVANLNAEAVITGNVGPNACRTLNAANVKIYLSASQSVKQAVEKLKAGELEQVNEANVEGHWS